MKPIGLQHKLPVLSSILLGSFLLSGLLGACGPTKSTGGEFSKFGFDEAIYSTRPQTNDPTITILKLNNPALLETSERKEGKLQIDAALLKAIQTEQAATVESLQKISPEIKVLLRYKLVLNGLAVLIPPEFVEKVKSLPNVVMTQKSASFGRPVLAETKPNKGMVGSNTSVKFIGAEAAYAQGIHGEGMRVGVIDTGVDYTHKMFLGEGTEEAYKANDPAQANAAFPGKKVVGGIDLVGTAYDSGSLIFAKHIPVPDVNPLDEAGHGTHVAGTIAGLGDGVNTYDGVAPAAELYAIKVFGAKGSTSDEIVIAALEYAVDPTGDLSFSKQLDVVNLSLGSDHGNPHIMYNHAIRNLVRGGTIAAISAGNAGDKPYIVGAPGIADDSISVASTLDNQNQNIQFGTVEFAAGDQVLHPEAVEAGITKKLEEIDQVKAELIYVGDASKDFDEATQALIKGKITLIDRGIVNFADKIKRAQEAGAIGVIVANNQASAPIVMGGEGKFNIPGVMISQEAGLAVKESLKKGSVIADMKSTAKVEKPELIDTISDFSSRGPRSEDGLIKPEISSPGSNTISAARGLGNQGVALSGTSMASPHIAGVMALLKQKFNTLTPAELKSVLMAHAKVISDKEKKQYSIARQGAGRVQIAESLAAQVVSVPASLSFGITDIESQKTLAKTITLKNISAEAITLKPEWTGSSALQFSVNAVTLAAGESKTISISVKVLAAQMKSANDELDGYLRFSQDQKLVLQMPALVVARQISQINAKSLVVRSTSRADSAGSAAEVEIQNAGQNKGQAFLFNLLGTDSRKTESKPDLAHNKNCDMQSAGYRIVEKDGARILQVAVKLYEGMTTWNTCEVNVQIDSDGDNAVDQEIAGVPASSLPGLTAETFVSLLLDGPKARALRKQFEADTMNNVKDAKEDYTSAVLDQRGMQIFDNSTLAIIEADISNLALAPTGELRMKISTTHQDSGAIEYDDYLQKQEIDWKKISVNPLAQAFAELPEVVELKGQESRTLPLLKGYGSEDLILYAPQNKSVRDSVLEDAQSQVLAPSFAP